jgi:hypothetical protein
MSSGSGKLVKTHKGDLIGAVGFGLKNAAGWLVSLGTKRASWVFFGS